MSDTLLIAVLDTLLPGDAAAAPLPAFSQADIDCAHLATPAAPILAAIDRAAFAQGTKTDRIAELQKIERSAPEAFRTFLGLALAAYYQAPVVLAALGWRHEPPQPAGHRLGGDDAASWHLLERVRKRGRLWRE